MSEAEFGKKIEQGGEHEQEPRVFVEVGTNLNPVPAIGEKKFEGTDIYIGVDKAEAKTAGAKMMPLVSEEQERRQREGKKNIFFITVDAAHLPLEDNSVDELYFGNFFGDPNIISLLGGREAAQTTEKFLREAYRALKPKGKITIKENNSPADQRFLQGAIHRAGFSIKKIVRPEDRDWQNEVAPYDKNSIMARRPPDDAYFLELEKLPTNKQ